MTAVDHAHLLSLYRDTDDPWRFRTSDYEAAKFATTLAALPRYRFAHVLELGCGNGELARRVAARAEAYTGVDAVPRALDAARQAVPGGRFVQAFLPCPLPPNSGRPYDLVLLSEILYFLDPPGLTALAGILDRQAPSAEILTVTWTGPSGNGIEGDDAVEIFRAATGRHVRQTARHESYRIDTFGRASAR